MMWSLVRLDIDSLAWVLVIHPSSIKECPGFGLILWTILDRSVNSRAQIIAGTELIISLHFYK